MSERETITNVIKANRATIPKEFREANGLQPKTLLNLVLSDLDKRWYSIQFHSYLRADGQITIPIELYRALKLTEKQTLLLRVQVVKKT